jgi:hypothetical protein
MGRRTTSGTNLGSVIKPPARGVSSTLVGGNRSPTGEYTTAAL